MSGYLVVGIVSSVPGPGGRGRGPVVVGGGQAGVWQLGGRGGGGQGGAGGGRAVPVVAAVTIALS